MLIGRIWTDSSDVVLDCAQPLCTIFDDTFVGIEMDGPTSAYTSAPPRRNLLQQLPLTGAHHATEPSNC